MGEDDDVQTLDAESLNVAEGLSSDAEDKLRVG